MYVSKSIKVDEGEVLRERVANCEEGLVYWLLRRLQVFLDLRRMQIPPRRGSVLD